MNTIKVALVVQNCLAGNYEKNLESTRDFIRFDNGLYIASLNQTGNNMKGLSSFLRSNPMRYFMPNRRTDLFQ